MFEEGRYPMVADPAYLTHFVRRYAASLGLDELAASRELIAETERSPSPLHADAEPSTADRRDPAANANHAPGSGISQLMNRRMPKLGRNAWSGLPTFRGRGRSRPRIFKFYVGPLALIVAVAIVALSSLSYLGRDETPLSVPKATSALEGSSAMPTEATAAPSHEPDRIAASAAIPSLPPAADVSRPSVDASVPAAVNVAVRDSAAPQGLPHQPTGLPRVPPTQSSTNKASDTLRAEQLARMRAASAAE
jgi:cytoskeletal protein RodZ